MRDPILEAIKYADHPDHGGAGYTLTIQTTAFRFVGVHVRSDKEATGGYRLCAPAQDPSELFFNPAHVVYVGIEW
jgi:hypothetical protein